MNRKSICVLSLVVGVMGIVACSSDDTAGGAAPGADAATVAPDASGSTTTDGATEDVADANSGNLTDAAGDGESDAAACQSTSDIPTPAAGKATIKATFSNVSGTYSGDSSAYVGVEANGTATTGGGFSNWTSVMPGSTQRSVYLVLASETPEACTSYPTPSPLTIRYVEGSGLSNAWNCSGSAMVDTVSGKSVTFHFSVPCARLSIPSNDAVGTFTLTGHGAATTLP